MKQKNINIFEYTNYRTFLNMYAEETRKKNPSWSYGQWAKKMELSGTSALTMVLNGQRNAGPELCNKFSNYFLFDSEKKNYFFDLVNLERLSNNSQLKVLLMEKIAKTHPSGTFRILDDKTFNLISKWYYYAILEMTDLSDFQNDADWIVAKLRFKITATEVKKAVSDLLKLNLLKSGNDGKLRKADTSIDTTNDISNEAIKRFHEQMLENAKEGVRSINVSDRDYSGMTISIEKEDLHKAKKLIRKFQDEFSELMTKKDTKDTNAIYQLNVQMFPLTK